MYDLSFQDHGEQILMRTESRWAGEANKRAMITTQNMMDHDSLFIYRNIFVYFEQRNNRRSIM